MGKGYSYRIEAECLENPVKNNMDFFNTINCHIAMHSPACGQQNGGIFGCGTSMTGVPSTQPISVAYVLPNELVLGKIYGSTNKDVSLMSRTSREVYFTNSDAVNYILPREFCLPPYNRYKASGPPLQNAHCYQVLSRREFDQANYIKRLDHDFVDSYREMPEEDITDRSRQCGDGCLSKNWLAFSHPAQDLYTTIPQPFLITTHFEQSGASPSQDTSGGGNNFMPFCAPIEAYVKNDAGTPTKIGNYIGYSFVTIFGASNLTFPVKKYLPFDEWDPEPKPGRVRPTRSFYSIEVWIFMVGSNNALGSPLLNKIRFYLYSKAPGEPGQRKNWTNPFIVCFQQGYGSGYSFNLNCRILGRTDTPTAVLNFTGMQILITY